MTTLLETFRPLAAFQPARVSLAGAPWETYVDWAIAQGLGSLAAYNLEYQLGGGGAPDWVRDRLLSVHQGTLNDNVMKMVRFKRAIAPLEGRRIVLLGAAAFAEGLYPHVGFRPIEDLHLLVPPRDVGGLTGFLSEADWKPQDGRSGERGADRVLSDGRTEVFIHGRLFDNGTLDAAILDRSLPMRALGPSIHRLELEDAVLWVCREHALSGYTVPFISFIDLRELLLGTPQLAGPYSRPPQWETLRERARAFKLERALYVSTAVLVRLFPELSETIAAAQPLLRPATRRLLDRWVVGPVATVGQRTILRGVERLRRLLTGRVA